MTEEKAFHDSGLRKTGERLVPTDIQRASDYIQFLRHIFPYHFVEKEIRSLANTDRVLEVGFGAGYGTPILAGVCGSVVGIDVEQQAVDHASSEYAEPNVSFKLYDGTTIPFDDNSFDIVVSFQVIEHVVDDAHFVGELCRVLKPGGRLYISTPNRLTRLEPGEKPFNRFHVREYSPDQLKFLLEGQFYKVAMMGISATQEIHSIEASRVKQGPVLKAISRMGIRKLVPLWLDMMLARALANSRMESTDDFRQKYSLDDFRVETVLVDQSLDLFGVCVKQVA
jgi:SAM-dependent methyltransferase